MARGKSRSTETVDLTYHERYRRGARGGPKTAQDYCDIVTSCLDRAIEHILMAGEFLSLAKGALDHGEWARMFTGHATPVSRSLPFTIRTAQRLMKIHAVFSDLEALNATRVSLLPTAWGTLYELARLPEPILTRAFDEERIFPAMRRAHVNKLRYIYDTKQEVVVTAPAAAEAQPQPQSAEPETDARWGLRDAVDRIRAAVEAEASRTSVAEDWHALAEGLRAIARELDEMATAPSAQPPVESAPCHCTSCDRDLHEDELAEVRECSKEECAERFDAAVDGRNCPSCNRPFTRLITKQGCPDCLGEDGEVVEAEEATR